MRGTFSQLTLRAARLGTLAITGALALGHLTLLLTQWSHLSWTQAVLLAAAVGFCAGLAAFHRALCRRPVFLLIFALASLVAHPPGDVNSAASMAVLPVLALLTALLSAQVARVLFTRVAQTPASIPVPVAWRPSVRPAAPSLCSRPPPAR